VENWSLHSKKRTLIVRHLENKKYLPEKEIRAEGKLVKAERTAHRNIQR
jgi:hypothetical protein